MSAAEVGWGVAIPAAGFALTGVTSVVEDRIAALVKQAVG
jgi:hypothetical protein